MADNNNTIESNAHFDEVFNDYKNAHEIDSIGKQIGTGAFGVVKDVKIKNKVYAGKLVIRESSEEDKLTAELKGPNIIRINKICKPRMKHGNTYHLIIMEKAILRDLGKLNEYFHYHNLLKLNVKNPFDITTQDTLLRYYSKQIIAGLEILDRNNYVHFDIKPENILIMSSLILKLSDFSILKEVNPNVENMKIPGGTPGYTTPEYYMNQKVNADIAKKQDYFALGATLFYLKYGFELLKCKKYEDKRMIAERIVDIINRKINYINSQTLEDRDLIIFLTKLIKAKPEERLNFEEIFRNKWLNKNLEYINKVNFDFETDEEKLLIELQKQDFFIKKKEIYEYNRNRENKEIKDKNKKNTDKKFKFKKKKLGFLGKDYY